MHTYPWPVSGINQAQRQEGLGMFEEPKES